MVTIIIIGVVLIALIVGYTLHRQRKLQQQYQEEPIERVTKFDLEVDIKGGQAVGGHERRKSRLWMLMWAAIAAVIVVCAAICGIMKWNAGAEQRQMAKAEKQRLEKLNDDEFSAWVDDNVSLFSDIAIRVRFEQYKKEKFDELQTKLNELEAERAELEAKWTQSRENIDQVARDEQDVIYDCCLKNFEEQQKAITSGMDKIKSMTIYDWQGNTSIGLFIIVLVWGVVTWIITFFLRNRCDALSVWLYWLSFFAAVVFWVFKLLFVGVAVGLIIAWVLLLFLLAVLAWGGLLGVGCE